MSSIVLDQALERLKSPFWIQWSDGLNEWVLRCRKPNKAGSYYFGSSTDKNRVLVAYNENVRRWKESNRVEY